MKQVLYTLLMFSALVCVGCRDRQTSQKKTASPTTQPPHRSEADLAKLVLTGDQVQRLGVETVAAETRQLVQVKRFGGEVMIPDGQSVTISAPLTGTLAAGDPNVRVASGVSVKTGQALFLLKPILGREQESLSPADRISLARARADLAAAEVDAEGQIRSARATRDAALAKVQRAEELLKSNAGSVKALQEAKAELAIAEASMEAAQRRLEVLQRSSSEAVAGSISPLPIEAQQDSVVVSVHVKEGQEVTAGTTLITLAALDPLWIRVPVYVGDLDRINVRAEARMIELAPSSGRATMDLAIKPIRPFSKADPAAATIDLVYEVRAPPDRLSPGQRVMVLVPLTSESDELVVPWSAVLYDIHGGTWVYQMMEANTFIRRRVEIDRLEGDLAVVARGLNAGTHVVTAAAAELYGTEFGIGK